MSDAMTTILNDSYAEVRVRLLCNQAQHRNSSPAAQITIQSAFYGACSMQFPIVADARIKTASINGKRIRVNPEFWQALSMREAEGLIAHEVLHCMLLHPWRRPMAASRKDWNIACDLAINDILRRDGFTLPDGALFPEQYNYPVSLSAEEYWRRIIADRERNRPRQPENPCDEGDERGPGGSSPDDSDDDGEDDAQDDASDDGDSDDDSDDEDESDGDAEDDSDDDADGDSDDEGDSDDDGDAQDDADGDAEDAQPADADGDSDDDPGGCGGVDDGDPDDEVAAQTLIETALTVAQQRGDISAAVTSLAQSTFNTPKLDWIALLWEYVTEAARSDYSWLRPARRMLSQDIYLPGLRSDELGDIVIAVDESGSMSSAMVDRAFSELAAILSSGLGMRLTVIHHDSRVVATETWAPGEALPEFARRACGGTSHIPVFDWIAENVPDCRLLVCLSDMYSCFPPSAHDYPVVWIAIDGPQHDGSAIGAASVAPFGRVIEVCAARDT